jgi:ribonuclease D
MKYTLITKNDQLSAYLRTFDEKKNYVIALDIEAELNRHAYGEKLCLIQIFDGTAEILIDPFKISRKNIIALFTSPRVLKVMYDASSDSSMMKSIYGIDIKSVLDLRPAVDLLGYEKQDLYSVLSYELGIVMKDKSKFQKGNWLKRPIGDKAINYALNDVRYLLALKDRIIKKLQEKKLLDIFFLKNMLINTKDYTRKPEDNYKKIKGYYSLSAEQRNTFVKVYDIRDRYAKTSNMPPFNVVSNTDMIKIVQDTALLSSLKFPRRLSAGFVGSLLRDLKKAII